MENNSNSDMDIRMGDKVSELKLTDAIMRHRKMWNWIADKTEQRQIKVIKQDYFEENNLTPVVSNCYMCEYTKHRCHFCPIKWPNQTCVEPGYIDAPYLIWSQLPLNDWEQAAYFARIIANLPLKDEIDMLKEV